MRVLLRGVLAAVALLAAALPACAERYSSVVVFGDSNVDNGARASQGTALALDRPATPGRRNCNGPVVVEYLAASLGVPLLDFAFSGATTARTPAGAAVPGALSQIEAYLASLGGRADPNALYVYWAGSNNLVGVGDDAALLAARVAGAVADMGAGLRALSAAGASQIVVANRLPRASLTSRDNLNGIALNAAISAELPVLDRALGAHVMAYDAYGAIQAMILNPARFGFEAVAPTDLCALASACAADPAIGASYVFWDAAHKTTRVHTLMAASVAALVAR